MSELFTVVNRQTGIPIVPIDCNPESDDEGMLVYWSREAAELAAEHQSERYEMDCEARSLNRVIAAHDAAKGGDDD